MASGTPVIAMQSGGPIETVNHPKLGQLIPHATEKDQKYIFKNTAAAIENILENSQSYVADCKLHVRNNFSFSAFQNKIMFVIDGLVGYELFGHKRR